jgi:hypothetical protein
MNQYKLEAPEVRGVDQRLERLEDALRSLSLDSGNISHSQKPLCHEFGEQYCHHRSSTDDMQLQQVGPTSRFESLSSFRPETYTMSDTLPALFSYDIREVYAAEHTRVDHCTMFFAVVPRQWIRITVSITTTIDSPYWSLGRVKVVNPAFKGPNNLPNRTNSQIEVFLRSCHGLLQDVAEVHTKGFVVGSLSRTPDCGIGVDANDRIVFHDFQTTCSYSVDLAELIPPEYRRQELIGTRINASPQTDLYDLGMLLLRIVTNTNPLSRFKNADSLKIEDHDDITPLSTQGQHTSFNIVETISPQRITTSDVKHQSSQSGDIFLRSDYYTPNYILEIIASCCANNPTERLPAWKLLEKFPSLDEDETGLRTQPAGSKDPPELLNSVDPPKGTNKARGQSILRTEHSPDGLTELKEHFNIWASNIACDSCRNQANEHWFHCGICDSADFDICPRCFHLGIHCSGSDHYLREYNKSRPRKEEIYHSCVRKTGQREVIDLSLP